MLKQLLCWLRTQHEDNKLTEWLDRICYECWHCGYKWEIRKPEPADEND